MFGSPKFFGCFLSILVWRFQNCRMLISICWATFFIYILILHKFISFWGNNLSIVCANILIISYIMGKFCCISIKNDLKHDYLGFQEDRSWFEWILVILWAKITPKNLHFRVIKSTSIPLIHLLVWIFFKLWCFSIPN